MNLNKALLTLALATAIEACKFTGESNMKQKTFKVQAMGDTMYFAALDLSDAKEQFKALCGDVPASMLNWTEVDELPAGEEYAVDVR